MFVPRLFAISASALPLALLAAPFAFPLHAQTAPAATQAPAFAIDERWRPFLGDWRDESGILRIAATPTGEVTITSIMPGLHDVPDTLWRLSFRPPDRSGVMRSQENEPGRRLRGGSHRFEGSSVVAVTERRGSGLRISDSYELVDANTLRHSSHARGGGLNLEGSTLLRRVAPADLRATVQALAQHNDRVAAEAGNRQGAPGASAAFSQGGASSTPSSAAVPPAAATSSLTEQELRARWGPFYDLPGSAFVATIQNRTQRIGQRVEGGAAEPSRVLLYVFSWVRSGQTMRIDYRLDDGQNWSEELHLQPGRSFRLSSSLPGARVISGRLTRRDYQPHPVLEFVTGQTSCGPATRLLFFSDANGGMDLWENWFTDCSTGAGVPLQGLGGVARLEPFTPEREEELAASLSETDRIYRGFAEQARETRERNRQIDAEYEAEARAEAEANAAQMRAANGNRTLGQTMLDAAAGEVQRDQQARQRVQNELNSRLVEIERQRAAERAAVESPARSEQDGRIAAANEEQRRSREEAARVEAPRIVEQRRQQEERAQLIEFREGIVLCEQPRGGSRQWRCQGRCKSPMQSWTPRKPTSPSARLAAATAQFAISA